MKLNGLDLNKLAIFASVAKSLAKSSVKNEGYRGASEELNLTRSAISQAISSLEISLGRKLFHRVGNRLTLTAEALQLYQSLSLCQSQLEQGLAQFTQRSVKIEGELNIGSYLEFAKSELMPVVEDFMRNHPEARLKFTFDSPSRIRTLLEEGHLDFSISIFPHSGVKSIEVRQLYREELLLVSHVDLASKHIKREKLQLLPVIDYFPKHLLFQRWWKHQFGHIIKRVNVVAYAATAEMVFEMVKRKLGIGVIPHYALDRNVAEKITIIQPTERRLFDHLWLNQFRDRDPSPAHRAFLETLRQRFKF